MAGAACSAVGLLFTPKWYKSSTPASLQLSATLSKKPTFSQNPRRRSPEEPFYRIWPPLRLPFHLSDTENNFRGNGKLKGLTWSSSPLHVKYRFMKADCSAAFQIPDSPFKADGPEALRKPAEPDSRTNPQIRRAGERRPGRRASMRSSPFWFSQRTRSSISFPG